ncbi:MAG: hypothetical protein QOI24_3641 [Acidobacteriota bacterium]|jgi:hypothetical protein|nr:hypothetical protein [Acidobacteriota bacterium]
MARSGGRRDRAIKRRNRERQRLDLATRQHAVDDRQPILESRVTFRERHSVTGELTLAESRTDSHHHPPAAQMREPRNLLGEPQRVMQRHDRYAVTDADPRRARGDRRRKNRRRGDETEPGEMMLGEPDALESVALREVDFPQRLFDHRGGGAIGGARQQLEDANIHRYICTMMSS